MQQRPERVTGDLSENEDASTEYLPAGNVTVPVIRNGIVDFRRGVR